MDNEFSFDFSTFDSLSNRPRLRGCPSLGRRIKHFSLENRMTCKCSDDVWLPFKQAAHRLQFKIYDLRKWVKKNPHNMKWIKLGAIIFRR